MLAGDLVLVVAVVFAANILFAFRVEEPVVRIVVGTLFVLLCPGYAFVAALFPESSSTSGRGESVSVDGFERLLLAVGSSIVLAPLLGLALNYTPVGLEPTAVVTTISAFTLIMALIAAWRRSFLPPDRRYTLSIGHHIPPLRALLINRENMAGTVAAIVVLAALVTAVGGVGWAIYERSPGETFTEFYVLSDEGSEKAVMNGYPDELTVNEPSSVRVGVANEEHRPLNYTIVTSLQKVRSDNGSTTVVTFRELDRTRTTTLRHGEEWNESVVFAPSMTGENLRLTFSLYIGAAPDNPATTEPYRRTYVWVDVDEQ